MQNKFNGYLYSSHFILIYACILSYCIIGCAWKLYCNIQYESKGMTHALPTNRDNVNHKCICASESVYKRGKIIIISVSSGACFAAFFNLIILDMIKSLLSVKMNEWILCCYFQRNIQYESFGLQVRLWHY